MPQFEELSALLGADVVSTDHDDRLRHAHDAWPLSVKHDQRDHHPHLPGGVVRARDHAQVATLLRWCSGNGVPVTPWGLGSSVTGAPLAVHGGVVLDMSTMDELVEVRESDLTATVQAGMRGDELERRLNQRGCTLGHAPQSLARSSVGGWLATRATGQFSSRYGGIEDLVVGFTVVLPDGRTVELPRHPRAAVGPDLRQLFLGSEGTLGVITEVTVKIFPLPEHRVVEALRFPGVRAGLDALRLIMRGGLRPFLVRLYDQDEARHTLADPQFSGSLLLLGSEGAKPVAEAAHDTALEVCAQAGARSLGPGPVHAWLERRFDFSGVQRYLDAPGGYAETIEIAHFFSRIEALYTEAKDALAPLADQVLGHFSHVYPQGTSLYLILLGHAEDIPSAEARIERIWETTMDIALRHGAALSHHHGVGLARAPYLARSLGDGAELLARLKHALDPDDVLNPGKLGARRDARPGATDAS